MPESHNAESALATDAATHEAVESTDDATGDSAATETAPDNADPATDVDDENDDNAMSFSRSYVEKLRRENANYRERANRADELAQRLHTALVEATGRLADATDLPFDAEHLDDEHALAGAIDELLKRKPHLASRRPFGDVGQGNRGGAAEPAVNLAEMLRAHA